MVYGVRPQRQCDACGIGKEVSFKTSSVYLPSDEINTSGHSWFPGDLCNDQYFLVNQRHLTEFPSTTNFVLKQKIHHSSRVWVLHKDRLIALQSQGPTISAEIIWGGTPYRLYYTSQLPFIRKDHSLTGKTVRLYCCDVHAIQRAITFRNDIWI
jgi:hypothetical protein